MGFGDGADFGDRQEVDLPNVDANALSALLGTLVDGAVITPDRDVDGLVWEVTLGGNRTLANPLNLVAGMRLQIVIKQDAVGGRTLGYGAAWKFPGGVAPVLTIAALAVDVIEGVFDGANIYASAILDVK